MRTLKTSEAAALLNVSPNTLRAWERRFDYPRPRRSRGRHRLYAYAEVSALQGALQEGMSISSAISVARNELGADVHALFAALATFSEDAPDHAMEISLALRPLERSVEEVLLPALEHIRYRKGASSATHAFARRWAIDWLRRAHRLSSPQDGPNVLIGDAAEPGSDPAGPYITALELLCARTGADVLRLPVTALECLADAIAQRAPDAVVLAGAHACGDVVARWAYGVRSVAGPTPVALYQRPVDPGGHGQGALVLPLSPSEAARRIRELADGDADES